MVSPPQKQKTSHLLPLWLRWVFVLLVILMILAGALLWILKPQAIIPLAILTSLSVLIALFQLFPLLFPREEQKQNIHVLLHPSVRDHPHPLAPLPSPQSTFSSVLSSPDFAINPHAPSSSPPADFPPLKTLDNRPNNLPIQLTPFIGRAQEVAKVQHLLQREDVRLLTLTGPGGGGKTRLALQAAAELDDVFADGMYFVNLAPISDPALLVPTIAQTFGIREIPGQPLHDILRAFLREKQFLLVVDNFEQVVSAAVQVAELLAACPKLKVMVTSRAGLHVRGEQEFALPPLAVPDPKHLPNLVALAQYEAVALFIARAQAVKSDFKLTNTNALAVAEICARLDGLPLAIELAAARIKLLPPQALLARLSQRLHLLTEGARDVSERQQTLRNTIAWSYNLLDTEEQQLFRRLSVFVGACTLEAIEAICIAHGDGTGKIVNDVASLIDKSLLQPTEQEGEEPHWMMLETIRGYGLESLNMHGEMEITLRAHATYYLALVEEAELRLAGPQQAIWLERLERAHDNLRAALEWTLTEATEEQATARREVGLRLSTALGSFWAIHGHYNEGRTFLERCLARSEGARVPLRIQALQWAATFMIFQADNARGEVLLQQNLDLCRQLGDTKGIATSLNVLGYSFMRRGKITEGLTLTEEALRLTREVGEPQEVAGSLFTLADRLTMTGEHIRAQILFEEALSLYRKAGDEGMVAIILIQSAFWLWYSKGDVAIIHQRLQEGRALSNKSGDRARIASYCYCAALLALQEGETTRAFSLAQESRAIFQEIGDRWFLAWALSILGRVEAQRRDLVAAVRYYHESLALTQEQGEKFIAAFNLEGLAGVVAAQGELVWAAQLWGVAEVLREVIAAPLPLADCAGYRQAVIAARAQLGEDAFAAAWAEGRTMTPEQALAAHEQV